MRPAPPSPALPVSLYPGPSSWLLCPWSWAHELSQQGFLPVLGGLHRRALTSVLTWDEVSYTLLCWFSITLIIIASTGLCACLVTADTELQMIWWISLILTEGNITRLTELWDEWSSWRFCQTPTHWVPIDPLIMMQDFLSRTCSRGFLLMNLCSSIILVSSLHLLSLPLWRQWCPLSLTSLTDSRIFSLFGVFLVRRERSLPSSLPEELESADPQMNF